MIRVVKDPSFFPKRLSKQVKHSPCSCLIIKLRENFGDEKTSSRVFRDNTLVNCLLTIRILHCLPTIDPNST
ncbi:hypothetical protein ABKV19_021411 [Rosa sericea]